MSTILHLLRGQMSSPVNHFHRGADVRGGKCLAPLSEMPQRGGSNWYLLDFMEKC